MVVVLGTPYLNTTISHTIIRSVSRIIIHELYDEFDNDVALMILNESIPTNHSTVSPIILSNETTLTDTLCQIYGWGSTSFVRFFFCCVLYMWSKINYAFCSIKKIRMEMQIMN